MKNASKGKPELQSGLVVDSLIRDSFNILAMFNISSGVVDSSSLVFNFKIFPTNLCDTNAAPISLLGRLARDVKAGEHID